MSDERRVIHLDDRRRVHLGKVGRKEDTVYEVWEAEDGELLLRPMEAKGR